MANLVATASITVKAPIEKVWDSLVDSAAIKQYMFGTNVVSDWRVGSSITWRGEWQGKAYEDKGIIKKNEPVHLLQYSHFSPMMGKPDLPENYHLVTIELTHRGEETLVSLSQDGNATEEARKHSEDNWIMMLESLKKFLEK